METYTVKPDSVENDGENGQPATWRRKVNQAAAPFSALLGIVVIFAGVIFVDAAIVKYTVIAVGILVMEAGIWYMANPIFTSERRYSGLRGELDGFIGLVRQLNAVALSRGQGNELSRGQRNEFDRLCTEMHQSVDVMIRFAGKNDESADAVELRAERLAEATAEAPAEESAERSAGQPVEQPAEHEAAPVA